MIKNKIISSLKSIITISLLIIINVLAVYFVDYISSDFTVGPWYNAIIIVIAFAVANSILWPIFRRFLLGDFLLRAFFNMLLRYLLK